MNSNSSCALATEQSIVDGQAAFLSIMEQILPWNRLLGMVRATQNGCPPARLERLLRTYLVQCWFGLTDRGAEDALQDSVSIRAFVDVDPRHISTLNAEQIRDFRQQVEFSGARQDLHAVVNQYLLGNRYFLRHGTRSDPVLVRYDENTGYLGRLAGHFEAMSPPYELMEILRFNALYREIFHELNPAERQRAEQFVERLIEGAASPSYVPRIFGVV